MKVENPDLSPINKPIICNKCRQSCVPDNSIKDGGPNCNYGLINASFSSGYHSILEFEDMNRFTFSICEPCLKKIFYLFITPPKQHRIYYLNAEGQDGCVANGDLIEVPETPENINKQMLMMAKTMRKWDAEEAQSKTCAILTGP